MCARPHGSSAGRNLREIADPQVFLSIDFPGWMPLLALPQLRPLSNFALPDLPAFP